MIGLEFIAQREYLGRGMLLGKTLAGKDFAAYFVTGRSESSRARKFEPVEQDEEAPSDASAHSHISNSQHNEAIRTAPTNPEALKKGNPALLIYNAVKRWDDSLVVSNGAQTDWIHYTISNLAAQKRDNLPPAEILANAFGGQYHGHGHLHIVNDIDVTKFEPDSPNFTPRISGILVRGGGALAICRYNGTEVPDRNYFEFQTQPGRARFISTYTGRNVPKGEVIPAFVGEPVGLAMGAETPEQIANRIYDALGPKQPGEGIISPGDDFRVGVVVAFRPKYGEELDYFILNREDRNTK